ncbi:SDR family oxidoreductase [Flavisolibacter nicotianae]|uniref:SDR family oxidoreductase n=1 Tax=Flavisolibacter nicotianae TaxID=2364882 RepID=UPI000EB2D8A7|nr:SDR family oxidoreductase [Flavisolibacter nicotianae]
MEKLFQNKIALVTGGSFGIGRATAVAFAQRGARVVIADWKEDPDGLTLQQIREAGSEGLFVKTDIAKTADVKALFEKIMAIDGRIDYAFNNAGIEGEMAPVHECTEENWDRTIAINLKGTWLCMKEEIARMRKQGGGVIVNCASIAGLGGFANLPAYVASKHAVVGLTKTAALENATAGIRVCTVCPGVIRTPMIDRVTRGDPEVEKQYTAMEPMGRMGRPEEIAETVVWLCSEAASFVTGISMAVDGGFMAG